MLFLLFQIDESRYAIDAGQVVAVIPLTPLRPLPHVTEEVVGVFWYQGQIVPVIDLSLMVGGQRCRQYLSTRIILVNYKALAGQSSILGLMVERAVETLSVPRLNLTPTGVLAEEASYLGGALAEEEEITLVLRVENILSPELQRILFMEERP